MRERYDIAHQLACLGKCHFEISGQNELVNRQWILVLMGKNENKVYA